MEEGRERQGEEVRGGGESGALREERDLTGDEDERDGGKRGREGDKRGWR